MGPVVGAEKKMRVAPTATAWIVAIVLPNLSCAPSGKDCVSGKTATLPVPPGPVDVDVVAWTFSIARALTPKKSFAPGARASWTGFTWSTLVPAAAGAVVTRTLAGAEVVPLAIPVAPMSMTESVVAPAAAAAVSVTVTVPNVILVPDAKPTASGCTLSDVA